MRLRSLCFLALVLGVFFPCHAQQPTGPATREGLLNSDEAHKPAASAEADATPKRPAGTVTRPKGSIQHPELDKAWADYDVAVAKVTESIKAAISKQFDAATAKGDLDAAEKWQMINEKFEKAGELPAATETKEAVSAAVADYKKAEEELATAYAAVVKALTSEKKIADAKAVRDESQVVAKKPPHEMIQGNVVANGARKDAIADVVFLAELLASDVSVNRGLRTGGDNGYGGRISVLGKASPKAVSMHPFTDGKANASFDVPAGCTHFEATAAVDDGAKGKQKTPLIFKVYADNREIWKSQPLRAGGPVGKCKVAVNGIKVITLVVECPGKDTAAWAVWCDPQFLKR